MARKDPLDRPAEVAPRSFWGLCAECIEDKRVRRRTLINERVVNLCDGCFRGGAIALTMVFADVALKMDVEWSAIAPKKAAE